MSTEDTEAREAALSFLDGKTPMAFEKPGKRSGRLSPEEKLARAEARRVEREKLRAERAAGKARAKEQARLDKIADAEGAKVDLPAVVLRDGRVLPVPLGACAGLLRPYLGAMCLDVEHSGYDVGHRLYELRTVQLGGYGLAVVLDAQDPAQQLFIQETLELSARLHAHSAVADLVPCVLAGFIGWDDAWAKMHDSVLYAKLTDPRMSGSDAEALKALARDLLREDATAPAAEDAKNRLFSAMGCLKKTKPTDPPERNGWYMVDKRSETMIRYAGSDVLDLAGVMMHLEPLLPVGRDVLDRERKFQAQCAIVSLKGFKLDEAHIDRLIAQHEEHKAQAQYMIEVMSRGTITNPSSDDTGEKLVALDPWFEGVLERTDTGAFSAAKESLAKVKKGDYHYPLTSTILSYRHDVTSLGLLLRPLKILCSEGDSRMRPTVYTINAKTGRTSCVRMNGQQFTRQGGVRKCVCADCLFLGIAADFQGCEIRVAAGLSGDRALLEAETIPLCHKCQRLTTIEDPCSCGFKDNGELAGRTGLHWMAAIEAFGKDAVYEHRYWCKRGIFCVPEQGTEILTRRGWLKHDEVHAGDETLGRDADGQLRWTRVLAVPHFKDAELVRVSSGKHWSATVTPDHRWVTSKRRDGGRRGRYFEDGFTRTEDLGSEHKIVVSARAATEHQLAVTPAEAALIAWVYTDGHVEQSPLTGRTSQGSGGRRRKFRASVTQAKADGIAALEQVLADCAAAYSVTERVAANERCLPVRSYRLRTAYARGLWQRAGLLDVADKAKPGFDLESFVLKLGPEARAAFLQAAIDAEGFTDKSTGQQYLSQNEGPVCDALLLAATLEGWHVRQYRSEYTGGNATHVKMGLSRPHIGGTRLKREGAGRGDVWCVTTGLGSWVMRQEGRVMLTGNCKLFGGGPETAARQVYCDVDPMRKIFTAFEALAPVYKAWDDWLRQCYYDGSMVWRDFSEGQNYSVPIDGKRHMIYRAYSGRNIYVRNGAHAAGNGAIQGTARELLVDGVLRWAETKWGGYPLLPIHDELLTWVPEGEANEAVQELKRCMTTDVLSSPGFPVLIGADPDAPFAWWPDSS